jgi:hypothetical protein
MATYNWYHVRFYIRGMARIMNIEARSIGDAKVAIVNHFPNSHVSFASIEIIKESK